MPDVRDDGRGGWTVYRNGRLAGAAFPEKTAVPGGAWFGRRAGTAARLFPGQHLAVAYVLRRCPDLNDQCPICGPTMKGASSDQGE